MRKVFKYLILTLFLLNVAFAVSADPGAPYIRYWVICGPFENAGLDTECIENEAGFSPRSGKVIGGKECKRYLSCEDKIRFDLEEVFGPHDKAVAYAFTEVYSPDAREVKLFLGSDDGVKIWLNGENIFTNKIERGLVYDEDKIDVKLNAGWNRLLIKVNNKDREWSFSARFVRRGSAHTKDLIYKPAMMHQLQIEAVEVSSLQPSRPEDEGMFGANNAIDKNRWSRWSSEFSDPQWIILDLGKVEPVKKILLNWESYAKDYSIELSLDKISWRKVYSTDIGDGGQDVINLKRPAKTRYIKVTGTQRGTRFGYSLWELQVFSQKK